ncbi:glycoside hydrolase family 26 protein [Paenibacillus sp. NEAU-GSW1]|uniref:glycoside hydrolase family 26 protein n=1 Tax=Paenibacillus sp. NEAU-GSW1 TaxID=2682486 RepID=UPI001C12BAF4|nr:glycosyl hydrolase [Paenibacillus sp. NEAU-GSW1]
MPDSKTIKQLCFMAAIVILAVAAQDRSSRIVPALSSHTDLQALPWTVHVTSSGYNYRLAKLEPVNGAYLGAYVLQDRKIGCSMSEFNRRTGKRHASFFKYVGYGEPFPAEWVEQVKAEGAFPHIAWEPNGGLAEVTDNDYLRGFARAADQSGVPIFLRFASEMNGMWTAYSGNPEQYIQVWRMVHDIFEKEAPQVAMVWTVLNVPEKPIESFYPGDRYVDWVGVNVYNVKYHNGDAMQASDFEDPLKLIDYVYNRFSRAKPIQLSEYGATHYTSVDRTEDINYAADNIKRLYSLLPHYYPRVKAVFYFDVNNLIEYNQARRVNDYSITNEPKLLQTYRKATSDPYYLSRLQLPAEDGERTVSERFTYRGAIFLQNGVLYVDEAFFTRMLKTEMYWPLSPEGPVYLTRWLSEADKLLTAQSEPIRHKIWSGYKIDGTVPIYRDLNALPLIEIAEKLGFQVKVNGTNINIRE